MDERLESEIFEEQFKKQKQAHNNSVVLGSLKQDKEQARNNSVVLEEQPSYISTGIKYLDNKIKNRSLSAFDYYMARKYLGMDLNVNLNGNLNITSENQTRVKNLTSATSKIYDGIKALNLGDRLIEKAQDNSGIFSALKRFANEKTNGFYGLNSDEAETVNALKNYSYSTARQMGGQLTNQKIKDAQEMTKFGFRSKEENTARIAQTQEVLLNSLRKNLQMLESLGGSVSPLMLAKIKEYQDKADYINEMSGKIDLKKYQSLMQTGSQ
ncbi:Coiled-coil domain-containing protein [Helicobacter pylori]|nr:Coiled-coil domain-containing protein [Helicobacter pylori]